MTADDWSHEETDDPLYADQRNFYEVEKWSRDWQRATGVVISREGNATPAIRLAI